MQRLWDKRLESQLEERRAQPRFSFATRVWLEEVLQGYVRKPPPARFGEILDISETGMRVRLDDGASVTEGQTFALRFQISATTNSMTLEGEVKRASDDDVGIEFTRVPFTAKRELKTFCEAKESDASDHTETDGL